MRTTPKTASEVIQLFLAGEAPLPRMAGGDPANEKSLEDRIQDLHDRMKTEMEKVDADPTQANDVKALIDNEIKPQLDELVAEKKTREQEAEVKSLRERVETLSGAIERLREPGSRLTPAGAAGGKSVETEDIYGPGSEHSFYADIKAANKGWPSALERMAKAVGSTDVKAMTESVSGAAGGFLVPDAISTDLVRLRLENSNLRGLFSSLAVASDTYRVPVVASGLSAVGWVTELAEKPVSDMTFGEITASVFTAAGLAVTSNQLLQDSRPGIDSLINEELARRLAILEEKAFIDGTGTNQPRGILNTSGVNSVPLTSTAILDLLDAILDAISAVETNYFGSPNVIVLHPRTWVRIVKARESGTAAQYIVGEGANSTGRRASDGRPAKSLFGVPVVTTSNIPTNKGAGTNESRVIVGNFREGLILDHTGITLDESPHVYFTSNQTVFRGETRVGFTAGRYPSAFSVISGVGLANG